MTVIHLFVPDIDIEEELREGTIGWTTAAAGWGE